MRIVVDTNILISAFVSKKGASAEILARCQSGELELLVSDESLGELRRVLTYPRVRKRLQYSDEQIDRFMHFLEQSSVAITPPSIARIVPGDADDDKFIALAGEAQYLISGDDHLLSIGQHQGVIILRPAAFVLLWNTLHQDPYEG